MNKILFCRKYFLFFLIINSLNNSILGEERSCINYPYPNGIYIKDNLKKKKQFIYTQSTTIKNKNVRKIEFIKKKNHLYAIESLHKHIKQKSFDKNEQKIGIYRIYSCFDNDGTYKISYAQRVDGLESLNIFQKLKFFIQNKFNKD